MVLQERCCHKIKDLRLFFVHGQDHAASLLDGFVCLTFVVCVTPPSLERALIPTISHRLSQEVSLFLDVSLQCRRSLDEGDAEQL